MAVEKKMGNETFKTCLPCVECWHSPLQLCVPVWVSERWSLRWDLCSDWLLGASALSELQYCCSYSYSNSWIVFSTYESESVLSIDICHLSLSSLQSYVIVQILQTRSLKFRKVG